MPAIINEHNTSQFIAKILRDKIGGNLGDFRFIAQSDNLLNDFMNETKITGARFGFFAQTTIFNQSCQITGDDHHQVFIILSKRFRTHAFKREQTNGLPAINQRHEQNRASPE